MTTAVARLHQWRPAVWAGLHLAAALAALLGWWGSGLLTVAAVLTTLTAVRRRGHWLLLLSPSAMLALLAATFYVGGVQAYQFPPLHDALVNADPGLIEDFNIKVAEAAWSPASAVVCAFALVASLLTAGLALVLTPPPFPSRRPRPAATMAMIVIALATIVVAVSERRGLIHLPADGPVALLRFGLIPWIGGGLAILALTVRPASRRQAALLAVALVLGLVALALGHSVKWAVFTLLGLTIATTGRVRLVTLVAGLATAAAASVMALVVMGVIAYPHIYVDKAVPFHVRATSQLVVKLVGRQAYTVRCLDNAMGHAVAGDQPWYFAAAVVPRVLWPDKPSLSDGYYYATAVCGLEVNPEKPMSASMTLLGEPLVRGGWPGLAAAMSVLSAFAILATVLGHRAGVAGVVVTVAALPAMADFDHLFALYLALSLKTALFAVPLAVLAAPCCRLCRPEGDGVNKAPDEMKR